MKSNDSEPANLQVGLRLRELRVQRGLSLRELARLSGLSANALSQIERGLASPSVSTLYRLVDGLKVPITAVFRPELRRETIVFRSASQRAQTEFPFGLWEGMGGEAFVGKVEPFMLKLKPGGESGPQDIVHTGHEFVLCLQGSLEYTVEGSLYNLAPGDTLLFAAHLRHRWRNMGEDEVRMVVVLSGYEEYERPMGIHIAE